MGAYCSSSREEDVFTSTTKSRQQDLSPLEKATVIVANTSADDSLSASVAAAEKLRVTKASKILIFGDNKIKVATACYLKALLALKEQQGEPPVEVVVGTRDPGHAKNAPLVRAGVQLVLADMSAPTTLLPAIRSCGADTVFIVSPSQPDRATQTISGISACRRAGVGHVVVLSQTCVESGLTPNVFGDQCRQVSIFGVVLKRTDPLTSKANPFQIETFVKTSRLSYTIVRLPILMDNYLSQLQSMAEHGVFYRPLPPQLQRNAVTISDVGAAVGNILITPGQSASTLPPLLNHSPRPPRTYTSNIRFPQGRISTPQSLSTARSPTAAWRHRHFPRRLGARLRTSRCPTKRIGTHSSTQACPRGKQTVSSKCSKCSSCKSRFAGCRAVPLTSRRYCGGRRRRFSTWRGPPWRCRKGGGATPSWRRWTATHTPAQGPLRRTPWPRRLLRWRRWYRAVETAPMGPLAPVRVRVGSLTQ